MVTEAELTEIRNYLLTKKLPIDILLEVQDHFISQISSIQQEENLDFETAFANVKESWRKELTLSWKGEMDLMDSTDFMRKMNKVIIRSNFFETIAMVVPYVVCVIIISNIIYQPLLKFFIIVVMLAPILFSFGNYIYHYEDFRLVKKYQNHILTLHQDGILIFMLTASNYFIFFSSGFSTIDQFSDNILSILGLLIILGGVAYSIVSQKNYLRQIKIVKPFLKYLEKTS